MCIIVMLKLSFHFFQVLRTEQTKHQTGVVQTKIDSFLIPYRTETDVQISIFKVYRDLEQRNINL